MSERLSDERVERMRANCEKVIAGECMPNFSPREVLGLLVEIQEQREVEKANEELLGRCLHAVGDE